MAEYRRLVFSLEKKFYISVKVYCIENNITISKFVMDSVKVNLKLLNLNTKKATNENTSKNPRKTALGKPIASEESAANEC